MVADTLIRALEELLKCDEFQAEILNSAKLVTGQLPQKKPMRNVSKITPVSYLLQQHLNNKRKTRLVDGSKRFLVSPDKNDFQPPAAVSGVYQTQIY